MHSYNETLHDMHIMTYSQERTGRFIPTGSSAKNGADFGMKQRRVAVMNP